MVCLRNTLILQQLRLVKSDSIGFVFWLAPGDIQGLGSGSPAFFTNSIDWPTSLGYSHSATHRQSFPSLEVRCLSMFSTLNLV